MAGKAYLTIDDSPSPQTDGLTDYLREKNIPAILFCRGDRLAENPEPAARAAEKGFVLANHAYSHRRASQLSFAEMAEEIEKTERLIEAAYQKAGKARQGKHFRFPHMDRGCGGWIVDYNALPESSRDTVIRLFGEGLNISLSPPHEEQIVRKEKLQDYLKEEGYTAPPFTGVTHEWYVNTELAQAVDAMFTFSTSDWMITPRHAGKWPCKTLQDLKDKIDNDPWLAAEGSADIILMHDQDGLLDTTKALLDHMLGRKFSFLSF